MNRIGIPAYLPRPETLLVTYGLKWAKHKTVHRLALVCGIAASGIGCGGLHDGTPAGCYTTRVVAASYNAKRNQIIIRLANGHVYATTSEAEYLNDPDKHIGPYAPNYSDIIVCPTKSQPTAKIRSNIVGQMALLFRELRYRK